MRKTQPYSYLSENEQQRIDKLRCSVCKNHPSPGQFVSSGKGRKKNRVCSTCLIQVMDEVNDKLTNWIHARSLEMEAGS